MNTKLIIFIALVVVVGFVVCCIRLLSTPTPEKNIEKGELTIVSHVGCFERVQNVTYFMVKGIVQNNYTISMRNVNITAIFYDAENKTVRKAYSYAALTIVKPGQRSPFEISVSSPKGNYSYSLTTVGIKTDENPPNGLQVVNQNSTIIGGYYKIFGEVLNKEGWRAVSVRVICAYYDSEGNITALSHTFTSPDSINAGSKGSFEINLKIEDMMGPPDSFELFVVVHHYEVAFIGNYVLMFILVLAFLVFVVYMKRRGW